MDHYASLQMNQSNSNCICSMSLWISKRNTEKNFLSLFFFFSVRRLLLLLLFIRNRIFRLYTSVLNENILLKICLSFCLSFRFYMWINKISYAPKLASYVCIYSDVINWDTKAVLPVPASPINTTRYLKNRITEN